MIPFLKKPNSFKLDDLSLKQIQHIYIYTFSIFPLSLIKQQFFNLFFAYSSLGNIELQCDNSETGRMTSFL